MKLTKKNRSEVVTITYKLNLKPFRAQLRKVKKEVVGLRRELKKAFN